MTASKLSLALALALFALPMAAAAQEATEEADQPAAEASDEAAAEEDESNFSWNVAATTGYVFRGVSQTDRDPAFQAGVDYSFGDSGIYVGAWGSNVDYGDGSPDIEFDTYIGWNGDLSEDINLDVMLVRYNYFGEDDDFGHIDYNELVGALTWNEMLTFTGAYTNDYSNSGESSFYFGIGGEWEIGNAFNLTAGVGHTDFEDSDGYNDWNLGINRDFGPVNAALNYYDTNIDGERVSDAFVLTFTIES